MITRRNLLCVKAKEKLDLGQLLLYEPYKNILVKFKELCINVNATDFDPVSKVYDVTVPNHIIYVRRNGKPCWSSNCWEGYVTIEITNTAPLPAKIYAFEGIAQVIFLESDEICEISYADKKRSLPETEENNFTPLEKAFFLTGFTKNITDEIQKTERKN